MIILAHRQKIVSQITLACTVAFILKASNRGITTRHTTEPRNRLQLVMNNTAEQERGCLC